MVNKKEEVKSRVVSSLGIILILVGLIGSVALGYFEEMKITILIGSAFLIIIVITNLMDFINR